MATIEFACPRCKDLTLAVVRQRIANGRLAWSMSFSCPSCGEQSEIDGENPPPRDIRAHLLRESGWWEVRPSEGASVPRTLQALRGVLGAPNLDMMKLKMLVQQGAIRGTRFEMEFMRAHLSTAGVVATLEPVDAGVWSGSIDV